MIQKAARNCILQYYEFHFYTRNSAFLYHTLLKSFDGSSRVKFGISPPTFQPPTNSLSSVNLNYARSFVLPRLLYEVGTFLFGYSHFLPRRKSFTTQRPSSLTRHRCIRVSPLCKIPLLPPVGASHVPVPMWLIILSNQLLITVL